VRLGSLLIGVLLIAPLASAQFSRASLLGQVTDSTNAPIPGAILRITRVENNETRVEISDVTGNYGCAFLTPGTYRIQVHAKGFKTLERTNLQLDTDDTLVLPLILQVGEVADHVTVGAQRESLDMTSASHVTRTDPAKLAALPLIGRQAYSLVSLSPGVIFTQEQFGASGFAGLRGWDSNGKFIINGGKEGTNQFLLHGAPVSLTGKWQFSPNLDAIEEFRVLTNTYDAQYGRTGGGTVITTLKGGGNAWHGNLFEYFHNSIFDANTTQNNAEGQQRGKHNTHQFGGSIGGALRRNKDFLFFSFEGFREIDPFPVVSDTPPIDLRNGDFSKYGIKIFDPLSANSCEDGIDTPPGTKCLSTFIRLPFPGNRIPANRISPIGRAILNLYPAPNAQGLTQNYLAGGNTSRYRYDQPMGRYDHHFNDRQRLSAIVTFERGRDFTSTNGFDPPAEVGNLTAFRMDQNYVADYTHILSPSTVFNVHASFGRYTEFLPDSSGESDLTALALGMTNMVHAPTVDSEAPPSFNLDLYNSIIGNTYSWATQNQWSVHPGIVHNRGRHVIHYGFEFAYAGLGNAGPGRANGEFSLTRGWTQQYVNHSQGQRDGAGVADLLLGLPSSGFVDYNDSAYRTWPYYALYFQDTWRVTQKVTLTLGLRYDVQIPFIERFNRVNTGFDYSAVNPLSDQVLAKWAQNKAEYDATNPRFPYPDPPKALYGAQQFARPGNRRPYDTDWTNVQPRVGVAWHFARNTVLRAGSGIFYRTATQLNQTTGFNQRTNYVSSFDAGVNPAASLTGPYSLQNPFPDGIRAPLGAAAGALINVGQMIQDDGRSRPIPRTYQYSLGFEHKFPWQIVAELFYSGSQTVHDSLPVSYDAPSLTDFLKAQQTPVYLNRRVANPFYGILPATSLLGGSPQVSAQSLVSSFPLYAGVTELTVPSARYRYDSLQLFTERRFADLPGVGLFTFQLAFTFSKSFESNHRLNSWNLEEAPVHQITALDKPKTLALTGLWDLPLGWGRRYFNGVNRFGGALLNGWAVDWIFTYSSGYPVPRPDAVFTCSSYSAPGGQNAAHWFNNDPSCYRTRSSYELRGYDDRFANIRNPAAPQLHLSVEKTMWLNDRYSLQLRGEAFNVMNSPILPGPNTTLGNPRFGQLPLQQNNFPRYIQIAAKIIF